ncbi:MAG: ferritin family protein [Desulfocapsaceae bacterium]|nr:ferritin family protein [Desulfocapsaceae bacterium]
MFTIADIRNIAMQIERNGEETYRKAAELTNDPDLAAAFIQMADEEKRHAEWFETIEMNRELTESEREMEAVGKTILQEMVKDNTFSLDEEKLASAETFAELINESKKFEEDTIIFYEMLSGFIDDHETMQQLHEIIIEEKKHSEDLRKLLDNAAAKMEDG